MTTSERPHRGRGRAIGEGVTWTAQWGLRLLLVGAGVVVLWLLIGALWSIVLPVLLAVILATVLWPPAAWLRRHRFPPALAATTVLLAGIVVLAGLIALISTTVSSGIGQVTESAVGGIATIQGWIAGPPLNLGRSELDAVLQEVTTQLQASVASISSGVLAGVTGVASGVITTLLVLVLAFLFVKDGPRFLPWVRSVAGDGAGGHLAEVLQRIWATVGGFIRTQAIVSFVDSVLIAIGLLVVGVPLALPLAVITFLSGFIPYVGALVGGGLAVLVALVSNGFTAAIIVLALILVVQQLDGNILQPVLQSRSLGLHAGVILLAVTAGGTLYGIAGAFLSVPVVAAAGVVVRYLGERLDDRVSGGSPPAAPPPMETLVTVAATPDEPGPDGARPVDRDLTDRDLTDRDLTDRDLTDEAADRPG